MALAARENTARRAALESDPVSTISRVLRARRTIHCRGGGDLIGNLTPNAREGVAAHERIRGGSVAHEDVVSHGRSRIIIYPIRVNVDININHIRN